MTPTRSGDLRFPPYGTGGLKRRFGGATGDEVGVKSGDKEASPQADPSLQVDEERTRIEDDVRTGD